MIVRHFLLDLDDVTSGMVLSDTVMDGHGDVLLPAGTVLVDAMLTSLRRRGIDQIEIVNDQISPEELAAEAEAIKNRLVRLFRNCSDHGASQGLLQSVMQYRLGEPP